MKTLLIVLGVICFGISSTLAAETPATQPSAQDQRLLRWWEDLEKPEPAGTRALLQFAANPVQTVAFFKEHLKPLTLSDTDLDKALADLGSDDESVWKPAFEKLEYFDPRLTRDLGTLMSGVGEQTPRNRLVAILGDNPAETYAGKSIQLRPEGDGEYNFVADNSSWWGEAKVSQLGGSRWNTKKAWTRALRAIVLLESIGTPDAVAILHDMATGHPDAAPTKAAQDALERIASGEK